MRKRSHHGDDKDDDEDDNGRVWAGAGQGSYYHHGLPEKKHGRSELCGDDYDCDPGARKQLKSAAAVFERGQKHTRGEFEQGQVFADAGPRKHFVAGWHDEEEEEEARRAPAVPLGRGHKHMRGEFEKGRVFAAAAAAAGPRKHFAAWHDKRGHKHMREEFREEEEGHDEHGPRKQYHAAAAGDEAEEEEVTLPYPTSVAELLLAHMDSVYEVRHSGELVALGADDVEAVQPRLRELARRVLRGAELPPVRVALAPLAPRPAFVTAATLLADSAGCVVHQQPWVQSVTWQWLAPAGHAVPSDAHPLRVLVTATLVQSRLLLQGPLGSKPSIQRFAVVAPVHGGGGGRAWASPQAPLFRPALKPQQRTLALNMAVADPDDMLDSDAVLVLARAVRALPAFRTLRVLTGGWAPHVADASLVAHDICELAEASGVGKLVTSATAQWQLAPGAMVPSEAHPVTVALCVTLGEAARGPHGRRLLVHLPAAIAHVQEEQVDGIPSGRLFTPRQYLDWAATVEQTKGGLR